MVELHSVASTTRVPKFHGNQEKSLMSVLHFEFTLQPRAGVVSRFGRVPDAIPSCAAYMPGVPMALEEELPNFWAKPPEREVLSMIEALLPETESWDSMARMFGGKSGHRIQVWPDLLVCMVDVSSRDHRGFLLKVATLARAAGYIAALKEGGRVCEPEDSLLLSALENSQPGRLFASRQE